MSHMYNKYAQLPENRANLVYIYMYIYVYILDSLYFQEVMHTYCTYVTCTIIIDEYWLVSERMEVT